MGIQDLIARVYGSTHTPPIVEQAAPVAAPVAAPGASPAITAAPVAAPPPGQHPSILGAISGVLAPDAGSFWASALKNGLAGAKQGQVDDAAAQQAAAAANEKLKNDLLKDKYIMTPTGAVLKPTPTGLEPAYAPPPRVSETEALIDRWRNSKDPAERGLIERSLRGYQFTEPVLNAQTESRLRVKRATPGKAPSSGRGAGGPKKPPTGYIVNGGG